MKAQRKAIEMANIFNAENHRASIQVVEEQKKAVDPITTSNAETKERLEAQKKVTTMIVNSNAENLYADTQVEVEAIEPRKAMERSRPSTPPPPWCANREMPRELRLPGATNLHRELTREIPKDAADASVEQEILATDIKVIDLLAPYHKGNKTGLTKAELPSPREELTSPREDPSIPREEASRPREEEPCPREEQSSPREEPPSPWEELTSFREEPFIPREEASNPREEKPCPREEKSGPRKETPRPRRSRPAPGRSRTSPRSSSGPTRRPRSCPTRSSQRPPSL